MHPKFYTLILTAAFRDYQHSGVQSWTLKTTILHVVVVSLLQQIFKFCRGLLIIHSFKLGVKTQKQLKHAG